MSVYYNKKEISAKVFDFLYGCSMHDAILQQAFKGKKEWVGKVEQAKPFLREYIDCIVGDKFSSQEEHDKTFISVADNICKVINENKAPDAKDVFSFGNAQKLINIAAKHTYSICYWAPALREHFRWCHCPLDSIMLQKVWARYEKDFGNNARQKALGSVDFFCKAWGNEGQDGDMQPQICDFPKRYLKFQRAVKDIVGAGNLYAIEFDYLIW
jgi:hypothetical protein